MFNRYNFKRRILPIAWLWLHASLGFGQGYAGTTLKVEGHDVRLVKFLGKGAFGEVYTATSPDSDQTIAVKIFLDANSVREDTDIYFNRLYDHSPGSLRILQIDRPQKVSSQLPDGSQQTLTISAAELALPETLLDAYRMTGLGSVNSATNFNEDIGTRIAALHRVASDLIQGLEHMAKYKLAHGDIKPGNVFIVGDAKKALSAATLASGEHRVVIGDLDEVSPRPNPFTLTYVAPERLKRESTTWVADHYSLALSLAELMGTVIPDLPTTSTNSNDLNALLRTALNAVPTDKAAVDARLDVLRKFAAKVSDATAYKQLLEIISYVESASASDPIKRRDSLQALRKKGTLFRGDANYEPPKVTLIGDIYRKTCSYLAWRFGK